MAKLNVERINGKRIPENRIVSLTDTEVKYERDMGKITLIDPVETKRTKNKTEKQEPFIED